VKSESDLALFKQNWQIYKRVVDGNYMFHRDINSELALVLSPYFANTPLDVLDLGCGDTGNSVEILNPLNTNYFCGYDLSAEALTYAHENIQKVTKNYDLICKDMLEGVVEKTDQFDLVLSCYSLHHLTKDEKSIFFHSTHKALKKSGIFILVDVVNDEFDSLNDYYDHYLANADQQWSALTSEQLARVGEHVRTSDLPENTATLMAMAINAGYVRQHVAFNRQCHQSMVFYKGSD